MSALVIDRVVHGELIRLGRKRMLAGTAVAIALFAAVATLAVYLSADAVARPGSREPSLAVLSAAGGGTEAFATGVSFVGFPVLVVLIAAFASEFSLGTFRALLLREPSRLRLLVGKFAGMWLFVAGGLVVAEVVTFLLSLAVAPTQDVSTSAWSSLDSVGPALGDYGTALLAVTGWAVFGMAVGVLVRTTALALAVGIVWAGPIEHILQDSWTAAGRWFPGLLLEATAVGGTPDVSLGRAVALLSGYAVVALGVTAWVVSRRDVTA